MKAFDVIVIGGGPAGLAAAISARKEDARVILIEREERLGGILKQCIHDGFGLLHFGEKLSGPEYAERFEQEFLDLGIDSRVQTFVTDIRKKEDGFVVTTVSQGGLEKYKTAALILATGCRERTAKQVSIHGTRPSGVFTAGTAQHFVNLMGQMPTRRCVILGSGDIGLIMARRLTLEGAEVLGVYEVKPEPSGLTRNLMQCLEDYEIPLYLSHTVTRVFGHDRLEAVEISRVDADMQPIPGTQQRVECDALILSVGLIPENELAEGLGVPLDPHTKGPVVDDRFMTGVEGIFSCGNALHVNDLVDYVSESGLLAGKAAAEYSRDRKKRPAVPGKAKWREDRCRRRIRLETDSSLQYLVPQEILLSDEPEDLIFYFRTARTMERAVLQLRADGELVFEKKYTNLKPPEMKRLTIKKNMPGLSEASRVQVILAGPESRDAGKETAGRKVPGDACRPAAENRKGGGGQ